MASSMASAIRPSLRESRQHSGSPHTPNRFISSTQSSPGSSLFRQEEDPIVIELDARALGAGFSGESGPQCVIQFTPDNSRRTGDYRAWLPNYSRRTENLEARAKDYELWRNDLKDVDLGLLEDKLERTVREAYNKYLMVDAGVARIVLVLPSLVPHPVLSTVLSLLFERWKIPSVTLLPAPTMAVIAAGLRSGLVVDLGWEETIITAVYEYREVRVHRSTRAIKALTLKIGELLNSIRKQNNTSGGDDLRFDFDMVEEIVHRISACQVIENDYPGLHQQFETLGLQPESNVEQPMNTDEISFDWPTSSSSRRISIPRAVLLKAYLDTMIGDNDEHPLDDHEQFIGQLLYQVLSSLSSDVRRICMSRLIFTGQGAKIAGLPQKIIDNTEGIFTKHGWSTIRGKHFNSRKVGLSELAQVRITKADAQHDTLHICEGDVIEERVQKQKKKEAQPLTSAQLRQVDTFGPWAGASLISSLRVKSFVEIEREKFLSHGLAGAHRDAEVSVVPQQRAATAKGNDRTSWTLAGWG